MDQRKFVMTVGGTAGGALLLALAGLWPLWSAMADARTKSDRAKKDIEAALGSGGGGGDALSALDRETQALSAASTSLERAVTLKFREEGKGPKAPDVVYLRGRAVEIQRALSGPASIAECELPGDYGFPPGEIPKEQIPALLRRLEAIRITLDAAVRSGVHQVVSILQDRAAEDAIPRGEFADPLIERDLIVFQCKGTTRSIAALLHAVQQEGSFLGIVRVEIKKDRPDAPLSEASLALAVLTVREKPLAANSAEEGGGDEDDEDRKYPGR